VVLYLVVSPSLLVSLAAFLQFPAKKSSLLTPAESTLVDVYQNKSLKPPLESTLTQKRGEGVQTQFIPYSSRHPPRLHVPDGHRDTVLATEDTPRAIFAGMAAY